MPAATAGRRRDRRRHAPRHCAAHGLAAGVLLLASCSTDGSPPDEAEAAGHLELGEIEALAHQLEIVHEAPHEERAASAEAMAPSLEAGAPAAEARPNEVMVELAAVSSVAAALGEWERLRRTVPTFDTLEARLHDVGDGGAGARYRLTAGPFPNTQKIAALCARLAQRGLACLPADR
jgi:hypothetical protein